MAPSTAPASVAPLRGSVTVLRGRKPDRRTEVADLTDELTARKAEAVDLADYLLPLVTFLTNGARTVGPREYQAALAVAYRLRRYRTQNEAPA